MVQVKAGLNSLAQSDLIRLIHFSNCKRNKSKESKRETLQFGASKYTQFIAFDQSFPWMMP